MYNFRFLDFNVSHFQVGICQILPPFVAMKFKTGISVGSTIPTCSIMGVLVMVQND